MIPCVACGETYRSPSVTDPRICVQCFMRLPWVTQQAFIKGQASMGVVSRLAKERNASVRTFGGGRKR